MVLSMLSCPLPAAQTSDRDIDDNVCPVPGSAMHGKLTAEQRHPLLHAGDAHALARALATNRTNPLKAPAPVAHFQADPVRAISETKLDALRVSVLAHVAERLLRDPVQCRLDLGGQPSRPQR